MDEEMVARLEALEREVAELRQKLLWFSSSADQTVLGSKERPVRGMYVSDGKGGGVGFQDFDGSAVDGRWTKEK